MFCVYNFANNTATEIAAQGLHSTYASAFLLCCFAIRLAATAETISDSDYIMTF